MYQVTELGELIWQKLPDELYDKYEKIPFGTSAGRILMERHVHIPRNLELETDIKAKQGALAHQTFGASINE